jgi:hypothetical protein
VTDDEPCACGWRPTDTTRRVALVHCCLCHVDMPVPALVDHAQLMHAAEWGDALQPRDFQ